MKTQINTLNVTNISDLFDFSVVKYIAFDIEKCRAFFLLERTVFELFYPKQFCYLFYLFLP